MTAQKKKKNSVSWRLREGEEGRGAVKDVEHPLKSRLENFSIVGLQP